MNTTRITRLCVLFIVFTVAAGKVYQNPNAKDELDQSWWYDSGKSEIREALNRPIQNHVAKNVIIFLGDGMGVTVNTAGRIFKGQTKGNSGEENVLEWEKFPNIALMKTYDTDKQVADSASTATAYLGGVKTNYYTVGVDKRVQLNDCAASLNEDYRVESVLKWAQDAGKDTGFVTTTRLTHATPAALYAHQAQRFWECDTDMLKSEFNTTGCKDIGRQLIEDAPGKDINVILAGGRGQIGASLPDDTELDCNRTDGRNLTMDWANDKQTRGATFKYVTNAEELESLDVDNTDYIMGLFSGGHIPFEYYRKKDNLNVPSLTQMTEAAIKRLSRNKNGYFLLVEGGRIDLALHQSKAHLALEELAAMDDAVGAALGLVDLSETLIVVTADHSHPLTLNGYPERGNDILGTSTNDNTLDHHPNPTLIFTNGMGSNLTDLTYDHEKGEVIRPDLTDVDISSDPEFIYPAYLITKAFSDTHSGEDVAAFAAGPMSHLFHQVHEQVYVAHVMAYAACMGPFKNDCPLGSENTTQMMQEDTTMKQEISEMKHGSEMETVTESVEEMESSTTEEAETERILEYTEEIGPSGDSVHDETQREEIKKNYESMDTGEMKKETESHMMDDTEGMSKKLMDKMSINNKSKDEGMEVVEIIGEEADVYHTSEMVTTVKIQTYSGTDDKEKTDEGNDSKKEKDSMQTAEKKTNGVTSGSCRISIFFSPILFAYICLSILNL